MNRSIANSVMTERNFSVVDDATLGTGIVNEHEHEDDLVPEVPHVGPTTVGRDQGEREATKRYHHAVPNLRSLLLWEKLRRTLPTATTTELGGTLTPNMLYHRGA